MGAVVPGLNHEGGVVEHLPLTQYCVGPVEHVRLPLSVAHWPLLMTVTSGGFWGLSTRL
jgi:hypothetical protein